MPNKQQTCLLSFKNADFIINQQNLLSLYMKNMKNGGQKCQHDMDQSRDLYCIWKHSTNQTPRYVSLRSTFVLTGMTAC